MQDASEAPDAAQKEEKGGKKGKNSEPKVADLSLDAYNADGLKAYLEDVPVDLLPITQRVLELDGPSNVVPATPPPEPEPEPEPASDPDAEEPLVVEIPDMEEEPPPPLQELDELSDGEAGMLQSLARVEYLRGMRHFKTFMSATAAGSRTGESPLYDVMEAISTNKELRGRLEKRTEHVEEEPAPADTEAGGEDEGEAEPEEEEDDVQTTEPTVVEQLEVLVDHFSRCAFRAAWARSYGLLQDAARRMWTCATSLHLSPSVFDIEDTADQSDSDVLSPEPWLKATRALLQMLRVYVEQHLTDPGAESESVDGDFEATQVITSPRDSTGAEEDAKPLAWPSEVDIPLVLQMVVFTLKALVFTRDWETLVDIGGNFNQLTSQVFVETVTPLVLFAQTQISKRADGLQNAAETRLKELIAAFELANSKRKRRRRPKKTLVHIEEKLSEEEQRFQDEKAALEQNLLECREEAQQQQTALQTFLTQMSELKRDKSKALTAVDDTRRLMERYVRGGGVQSGADPSPVVAAWQKTITLLRAKEERELLASSLQMLADFQQLIGDHKEAAVSYSDTVDAVFGHFDAIDNWYAENVKANAESRRAESQPDARLSADDLHFAFFGAGLPNGAYGIPGLRGCLKGAVALSNFAQYVSVTNMQKRLVCCRLAALLVREIYTAALPHPRTLRAFSEYRHDAMKRLWTSLRLSREVDVGALEPSVLLRALAYVAEELIAHNYPEQALGVLYLQAYVAIELARDKQWIIRTLILRVRALTVAGAIGEATFLLGQLLDGPTKVLHIFLDKQPRATEVRSLCRASLTASHLSHAPLQNCLVLR